MSTRNKKSIISPQRLALLAQPETVYIITCHSNEYFCTSHREGCWRGFFSLYLQVVHGILFAKQAGIPWQVDFGNFQYRYSDEKKFNGDLNFWNYYFEQPQKSYFAHPVINLRYENYPLRVWNKNFIKRLHEGAVLAIVLKEEIRHQVSQINLQFKGLKVLGIHIRRTDHFNDVKFAPMDSYIKTVDSQIIHFDKLFLATDDEDVVQTFLKRYPEKVVFQKATRSIGNLGVHAKNTENRYDLGLEALLDCYSLAACDKVILSPSNLSYAVLLINPGLSYQLVESWPARWKRWKTLFLFYLNQWKIRKW